MSACDRFDLQTLGFQPIMHGNLPDHWTDIVVDDGWVHMFAKTLPSLVNNLWWNVVMDHDWNLDGKSLGTWQYVQHYNFVIPHKITRIDK